MTPTEPSAPLSLRPPRAPLWWLPGFVLGIAVVSLLSAVGRMNPPTEPYNLREFAQIPALDGGRVKPLDTVARVNLRLISQRESFTDLNDKEQPAIKWYLDVVAGGSLFDGGVASKYRVFRIENDQLLSELSLQPRSGLRYSFEEIMIGVEKIRTRIPKVIMKKQSGAKLDVFEVKLLELFDRIQLVLAISQHRGSMLLPPDSEHGEWASLGTFLEQAQQQADESVPLDPHANLEEADPKREAAVLAEFKKLAAMNPGVVGWQKMIDAYRSSKPAEFNKALNEYRENCLSFVPQETLAKDRIETAYNRFAPFYQCVVLYVLVFLICCLSWLAWTEPLRKSAFYLLYLTLAIQTAAILVRMYVQGRPPVTNLYSSAVFIGWGCVIIGLVLEKLYPIGIGNILAAVLGLSTTIISHNLATGGDTLEMMQAVLDTNFWLSTHVTTVTLGYTATFVAGFIGIAYICRLLAAVVRDSFRTAGAPSVPDLLVFGAASAGLVAIPLMMFAFIMNSLADYEVLHEAMAQVLTFLVVAGGVIYVLTLLFVRASYEGVDATGNPIALTDLPGPAKLLEKLALDNASGKKMAQMTYGVVCFATLLSFVGTVLGGIWADQSWGRFWGWDPKENGAVLIVLWNALILHARWAGMVRDRGMAVLVVAGNMITAWSWFGTNQLGIGLHAYGFDNRLAEGCRWFWISQLVIIGLGLIPQRYWSSVTRRTPPPPAPRAVVESTPPATDRPSQKERRRKQR